MFRKGIQKHDTESALTSGDSLSTRLAVVLNGTSAGNAGALKLIDTNTSLFWQLEKKTFVANIF